VEEVAQLGGQLPMLVRGFYYENRTAAAQFHDEAKRVQIPARGRVPDTANDAGFAVRGVKALANDIEVRLFATSERSDADIAAAVVHALEWDAFVPIEKLDVTVSKGWVTLKGSSGTNTKPFDFN
jgi:osmotically-inducible protein OsmY